MKRNKIVKFEIIMKKRKNDKNEKLCFEVAGAKNAKLVCG